jgi:hypothetical protein
VFAKCCLSCPPICTSSVCSLSVNFLFVTPLLCAKHLSVGLVVAYSSHIFCSPQILDGGKTAMTRLQGNLLNNNDEIAMQAHQQSLSIWWWDLLGNDDGDALAISQILNSGKTARARLHSDLPNNCGKTAILAHQQSSSIWWRNLLDNGDGGASEIFSIS